MWLAIYMRQFMISSSERGSKSFSTMLSMLVFSEQQDGPTSFKISTAHNKSLNLGN